MDNIKRFEMQDRQDYYNYISNNKCIIIKNRFWNGYTLTDKHNVITDDLLQWYVIDDTDELSDGTMDITKYIIKNIDQLKKFITDSKSLQFACLHSVECEI